MVLMDRHMADIPDTRVLIPSPACWVVSERSALLPQFPLNPRHC